MRGLEATEYPKEFRPDVQALRALAVLLVVLYHAGIPGVHGGFFGVDVFFVVSGFVITNVLLEERASKGTASIIGFYARRIRRILPAATVVLIATIFLTYHYLAFISGASVANDAKWVAAFVGNFDFARTGTNYFLSSLPPSTLQQYWSLGVEEQFYVVWPWIFVGLTWSWWHRASTGYDHVERRLEVARTAKRTAGVALWSVVRAASQLVKSPRRRLVTFLTVVVFASAAWCVIETNEDSVWAFFSPLTHAWELALGALIAVAGPQLRARLPRVGLGLQVLGTGVLVVCAWIYTSSTLWPGSAVIAPVLATGIIIAGGSLRGVDRFSWFAKLPPIQWLGNISYSLYLVHWPILTIATQYSLSPLPLAGRVWLVVASIGVAQVLYNEVENPIRRSRVLVKRRILTYAMGCLLVGCSYVAIYWHLDHNGQSLRARPEIVLSVARAPGSGRAA